MADKKEDQKEVDKGDGSPGGEIITINVGGCGVALGQSLNEQYCLERGITFDGTKKDKSPYDDTLNIQFNEMSKGNYTARSLLIDMDPYNINNVHNTYKYKSLFNKSSILSGKQDAASVFPVARYTNGKEMADSIKAEIKNLVDSCDKLQGFVINHGLTGGAGTGLTTLILEEINANYPKKCVAVYSTMHDETFLSHPTQVYNGILMMNYLKDYCDYDIVTDNKALYEIVQRDLGIKTPRFKHYNCLLNKLYSSITMPARYNVNNSNLLSIARDLVPIPNLKYLMPSFWPIVPRKADKDIIYKKDMQSLTNQCCLAKNFMQKRPDFDAFEDKYYALQFNYRGKIDKDKCNEALKWILKEKKITYRDFEKRKKEPYVQFHDSIPTALPTDDIIDIEAQATMIANNYCTNRLFSERLARPYDLLYSQRAYVHHYVAEGMEEGEFAEAREKIGFLEKDYLDAMKEPTEDED